eukprot:7514437-Alexandrium_andersonii.AAC.1
MIADGSVLWRLRVGAAGLELDQQECGGVVRRGPAVAYRGLDGAYLRLGSLARSRMLPARCELF